MSIEPFVVTLRPCAAHLPRCLMTDRLALRKLAKIAEKFHALAEKRRDDFAELYRSGRWQRYYTEDRLLAHTREVAQICERWAKVLEQQHRLLSEPEAPIPESDAPAIDRDAA